MASSKYLLPQEEDPGTMECLHPQKRKKKKKRGGGPSSYGEASTLR